MIGTRLGPYEVTAKLGEGGMGVVYRATDGHLGREVALKVLPEGLTSDAERLARFEREAKVLASLNHPNIAQIYGFEKSGEVRALVMELVEGPTLADTLAAGPIPLSETLSIARQIAEALEEAHEKGIVHRDLKPQNVKVSPDGKTKVLDFGLAKALDPATGASGVGSASQLAQSPTLTFGATEMGVILGTASYMAPEQAAGKAVDRRADIWAFGVVLFEMLSGRKLFEADTVPETLGAVFRQEISFDELPASTPTDLRRLLERCLERDPKLRLRDIGEARIALALPMRAAGTTPAGTKSETRAPGRMRALPWVLAVLGIALALAAMLRPGQPAAAPVANPTQATAFGVELPPGFVIAGNDAPVLDLSRDGRTLVFIADGHEGAQLFRRALGRVGTEPIEGSEGAQHPFLSPDGRWVGFFVGGRIRKLPIAGGVPVDLVNVGAVRGATWTDDGWIVFTPGYSNGLVKMRESGGAPIPVTELDAGRRERTHRWPSAVPGTPWILFSVNVSANPSFYDNARIDAVRLDTGERKSVYEGAWMARFAPPGTLLLQRRGSLVAVPFDPARAEITGPEESVAEGIGGEPSSGAGYFAAGAGGTLAYVPSEAIANEKTIARVGADGKETVLPVPPRNYWYPRLSPDARTLALDIGSGQGTDDDIWLYELASERLFRFTLQPASLVPAWSPDGKWIAYGGATSGRDAMVFRKRADGTGGEEQIWHGKDFCLPMDWSPDGSAIVVTDNDPDVNATVITPGGGEGRRLVDAAGNQWGVAFAPDGRHVAYTTTETGINEVFVSTYPEGGGKWQISVDGGEQPAWSRDGRRIFFIHDEAVQVVDVETAGGFRATAPRELFRGPYLLRTAPFRNYDVGPGDTFYFIRRRTDVVPARWLEVVLGWQSKLAAASPR